MMRQGGGNEKEERGAVEGAGVSLMRCEGNRGGRTHFRRGEKEESEDEEGREAAPR
jgi:hypothetical protein